VNALLATYQEVGRASGRLAAAVGEVAMSVRAPSRILVIARAAANHSAESVGYGPARPVSSSRRTVPRSGGAAERSPQGTGAIYTDLPAALRDLRQMRWDELRTLYEIDGDERDPVGRERMLAQALAFERCDPDQRRARSSSLADGPAACHDWCPDAGLTTEAIWPEPEAE
jgi:hypothetical protein